MIFVRVCEEPFQDFVDFCTGFLFFIFLGVIVVILQ